MAQEEGLYHITSTNPGDWVDDLPNERTGAGKDVASIAENQCLTYQELAEAYDAEGWMK